MNKKETTSEVLLADSDGQPITELTFADIDKTTIGGASRITLELIKCKQAISRAISRIDYLNTEDFIVDAELVKQIVTDSKNIDAGINLLIANQMSESLYSSGFKEI